MSFGKWLFEHTVVPVVGGAGMLSGKVKGLISDVQFQVRWTAREIRYGYDGNFTWTPNEAELAEIMTACGGTYSVAVYNSMHRDDWLAVYQAIKHLPWNQRYPLAYLETSKILAARGFIPKPFDEPPAWAKPIWGDDDEDQEDEEDQAPAT